MFLKQITPFLLFICTLSFNLHSAMTPAIPKPRFKKIADRNIPDFEKKHGKFFYYPLLQKDTQFCMIDFNRKYDGILQHNVSELSCRNVRRTIINDYKITVFAQHYANIGEITLHSMNNSLPLREASTNQELDLFSPFNNVCFYYYPIPAQGHSLDRTKYEKVFRNALQLNLNIARTRGIDQPRLDIYSVKVLQKLTSTLLSNFPQYQNPNRYYPILNQNIYVLGYHIRMEVTLKQLASLGLSSIEILNYKQTMLAQLENTLASHRQ